MKNLATNKKIINVEKFADAVGMQLILKGLRFTVFFFYFLVKFLNTFSFYTTKEISFKSLYPLLLSKGAEVMDRYNTFCINLKQGDLTVYCHYYMISESLGGPLT